MNKEIEFFSTKQLDVFNSMKTKLINYHNLGLENGLENTDIYGHRAKHPLFALLRKIDHLIFSKGDPLSVEPFLKRIIKGEKHHGKPMESYQIGTPEECYVGKGHFRWDYGVITLDERSLKAIKMLLSESASFTASTEFKYKELLISSMLVKSGVTFPNSKDDKMLHNQFKVAVINQKTGKKTKFDFFGSYNDYCKGITDIKDVELLEAFECFINDSISAIEDFEEWCGNFGYDTDSRAAEKIYKSCQKSLEKAEKIISGDLYEFYNELQEAINPE